MNRNRTKRPLPHEVALVFTNIEIAFDELKQGVINEVGGKPAFKNYGNGEWLDVPSALDGWCDGWQKILNHYRINLDQTPLKTLSEKLGRDEMLTPEEVDAAHKVIIAQKRIYQFRVDVYEVKRIINKHRATMQHEQQMSGA